MSGLEDISAGWWCVSSTCTRLIQQVIPTCLSTDALVLAVQSPLSTQRRGRHLWWCSRSLHPFGLRFQTSVWLSFLPFLPDVGSHVAEEESWFLLHSFLLRCCFSTFANILVEQTYRRWMCALLVKCLPWFLHDGLYRNADYILTANKKMLLKDFLVCESSFSALEFWNSCEKS